MATKITWIGGGMSNVGTGFSLPADGDTSLHVDGAEFINVGTVLEVRDKVARAVADLRLKLPPGITDEQISDAVGAAQGAANEPEQTEAIKRSSIWSALKDVGPEAIAFIIKTAMELGKGQ